MKYHAQITIEGERLYDYLKGEAREQDRSTLRVEENNKGVAVTIEAKDANAFRSCLQTIGSAMSIWERL